MFQGVTTLRFPGRGNLGRRELGHGLGSLRNGVLGQLSRQNQADGRLDLARRDSRLLVVAGQVGRLNANLVKDLFSKTSATCEVRTTRGGG